MKERRNRRRSKIGLYDYLIKFTRLCLLLLVPQNLHRVRLTILVITHQLATGNRQPATVALPFFLPKCLPKNYISISHQIIKLVSQPGLLIQFNMIKTKLSKINRFFLKLTIIFKINFKIIFFKKKILK